MGGHFHRHQSAVIERPRVIAALPGGVSMMTTHNFVALSGSAISLRRSPKCLTSAGY